MALKTPKKIRLINAPSVNYKALNTLKKNIQSIERLAVKIFTAKKNQEERDRQRVNRENRRQRENKIERTKEGVLKQLKNSVPRGTRAIDAILNFLVFTFFGWVTTKLMPVIPKLLNLFRLLKPAGDVFSFIVMGLIDGFASFVNIGYKTWDNLNQSVSKIKKYKVRETFTESYNALKGVIDGTTALINRIFKDPNENDETPVPKPQVEGRAGGGNVGVTRESVPVNRPITRTTEIQKPRPKKPRNKQQIPAPHPGKDVGGETAIRKFYRSPKVGAVGLLKFLGKKKNKPLTKTPIDAISNVSKILRSKNVLFGDLASVGSDIAVGQKPNPAIYKNTAKDVVYLAQFLADKHESRLKEALIGMADGGRVIPPSVMGISDKANVIDLVAVIIQKSVEDRVNNALRELKTRMNFDKNEKDDTGDGMEPGPGGRAPRGTAGGSYGGFAPTGLEKQIYEYLINEKKMNDNQALGLLANISRESKFDLQAVGDHGQSFGLFQWYRERAEAMKRKVPDWRTNWKGQIDYALSEPKNLSMVEPGLYASTSFSSSQAAADWWATKFERPSDLSGASSMHGEYLKNVPRSSTGAVKFREAEMPSTDGLRVEGGILPSKYMSRITSRVGMRWGREHKGNDYSGSGVNNELISAASPGIVEYAGWDVGGRGGNIVVVKHNDGTITKYFHLAHGSIKVKTGQTISIGAVLGRVGNTGGSTGTHLHFEVWKNGKHMKQPELYADSYFRFGGNVRPAEVQKLAKSKGKEGYINYKGEFVEIKWTPEQKNRYEKESKERSSSLSGVSLTQVMEQIRNLNLDNNQLVVQNVGRVLIKKNQQGTLIKEYYDTNNNKIDSDDFYRRIRDLKDGLKSRILKPTESPQASVEKNNSNSPVATNPKNNKTVAGKPPEKGNWMDSVTQGVTKFFTGKRAGGFIGNIPNTPPGYTSYENYSNRVVVAIQPVMLQNTTDQPQQLMPVPFPMPTSVNSTNSFR